MRKLALLEPLLVFGLIVAYIWKLRFVHPTCWIAIPALMIFSHLLRHESPRALGFQLHNLPGTLSELGPMLILIALLLLSAGMVLRTLRQFGFEDALFALAAYLPWGLAQQYAERLLSESFRRRALKPRRLFPRRAVLLRRPRAQPFPDEHHAPAGLVCHAPLPAYPQPVLPRNRARHGRVALVPRGAGLHQPPSASRTWLVPALVAPAGVGGASPSPASGPALKGVADAE
jgi:hypothetical protein